MSEKTVEEKQAQPATPAGTAPAKSRLRLAGQAWIALAGLCAGWTLAHILSGIGALASSPLRLRDVTYGAPAAAIGAAFGVVVAILGLKKISGQLDYHKPGQAKWVRLVALLSVAGMAAFGCYAFYQGVTTARSSWWQILWKTEVFGKVFAIRPILFPSALIFLAVVMAAYLFLNRAKSADFLIETEGELKKVSWPARKEYLGSSFVVVLVVVIVSLFLYVVDLGLSKLMEALKIGF